MNTPEAIIQFTAESKKLKISSEKEFLTFCKEAIPLVKQYPSHKDKIAYEIVCQGSFFGDFRSDTITEIRHFAMSLEVPDVHVYTGDGLSVKQKWRRLEDLVNQGLAKSGED